MRLLPVVVLGAALLLPNRAGACVVRGNEVVLEDVVVRPGAVGDAAELERVRALPGRTFVVYSFSGHAKSRHADVMTVVGAEFSRDRKFVRTLGDGDVIVATSER